MAADMDKLDFEIRNLDAKYAEDLRHESISSPPGISVPIMWNNELTPYFHLDLAAAMSAATDNMSIA